MIRTVTCVLILVLYGIQGKVLLSDEILSDVSTNIIHSKDKTEVNIHINVDLPTYKPEPKEIDNNDTLNNVKVTPKDPILDDVAVKDDISNTNKTEIKCNETKYISENTIDSDEFDICDHEINVDNGTALILTPLIEDGKIEEARTSSKVNSDIFLGFESYSGFLTVNKTYDSNLFFWYFPVQNKTVNETPWIIWLQGGPGASSLLGLFDEIGPVKVDSRNELIKNPFTWLNNHSLVFIDNPVGTGYSFTNHEDGYVQDITTYSRHLYTALKQLLQVFPELRSAPLYIAGESYAGKYVPALAMEIHKRRDVPGLFVNLQGVLIGNGFIDPAMISRLPLTFYNFGLLSKEQLDEIDPLIKAFQTDIKDNNSRAAKNKWVSLITVLMLLTQQKHAYNFLKDDISFAPYVNLLQSSKVKKAIHVGDIHYTFLNTTVNDKMAPDFLSSTKGIFEQLLEHYRVLLYCGQLDQMISCVNTAEHYRTWKWSGFDEFIKARRYPFKFNSSIAGYHKTGGRLTEVVIRGAGHMVPVDTPAQIENLVTRWTHNIPLSNNISVLKGSFIKDYIKNLTTTHIENVYL